MSMDSTKELIFQDEMIVVKPTATIANVRCIPRMH